MLARPTSTWMPLAAAGVLLAAYLIQGVWGSTRKSPAFDETGDIAAGLSYIQTAHVRANLQHPPLMKSMAGATLWLAGMRLPDSPPMRRMLAGRGGERAVGSEFLASAGVDRALLLARLPSLLCSTLLGALLFLWGRELAGDAAGLAALFIYVLDPNMMAHGYLATMDMGLAVFAMLFFYSLWRYVQAPDTRRLIFCGIAMGLMLSAKFSAIFLLPVTVVLLWLALPWRAAARASLLSLASATIVIQLLYLSPGGLFLYKTGLDSVNQDHNPDYLVFLAGQLEHSFAGYFAAAWVLKEPIATLLLGAIGIWAMRERKFPRLTWLFLLLPPITVLLAHTLFADDLGVRYILPAFPFAHLIAGIGAAWLLTLRWGRPLAAALGAWLAIAAITIYPDSLSYFNEAAAGKLMLDDSNVDWVQGLKQLRDWPDTNAKGRPVRLAYFGSYPPTGYIPNAQPLDPAELKSDSPRGLYAVSAHFVARTPEIARMKPTAIVGHAIYIYAR
jgi:hypothetical protein